MNIAATQYSGKYRALEIYVSGCKGPHCPGCHNSDIQTFDCGTKFDEDMAKFILTKIHLFDNMIDRIWILGGEPLDQDTGDLSYLFEMLIRTGKEIWLFTRYDLREIPEFILAKCSYVKSGRYDETMVIEEKEMYGVTLGSSNQTIYKRGYDY